MALVPSFLRRWDVWEHTNHIPSSSLPRHRHTHFNDLLQEIWSATWVHLFDDIAHCKRAGEGSSHCRRQPYPARVPENAQGRPAIHVSLVGTKRHARLAGQDRYYKEASVALHKADSIPNLAEHALLHQRDWGAWAKQREPARPRSSARPK